MFGNRRIKPDPVRPLTLNDPAIVNHNLHPAMQQRAHLLQHQLVPGEAGGVVCRDVVQDCLCRGSRGTRQSIDTYSSMSIEV